MKYKNIISLWMIVILITTISTGCQKNPYCEGNLIQTIESPIPDKVLALTDTNNNSLYVVAQAQACYQFTSVFVSISDANNHQVYSFTPHGYDYEQPQHGSYDQNNRCNIICIWKPATTGIYTLKIFSKTTNDSVINSYSIIVQ